MCIVTKCIDQKNIYSQVQTVAIEYPEAITADMH